MVENKPEPAVLDVGRKIICASLASHMLWAFILPVWASAIPGRTVKLLQTQNGWLIEYAPPILFTVLVSALFCRPVKIGAGMAAVLFYAAVASGVPDVFLSWLYLTVFIPLAIAMILMAWKSKGPA